MRDFVATVLADTEDTWKAIFTAAGQDYPEPTLTLFSGSVAIGLRLSPARRPGRSTVRPTRTSTSTSTSTISSAQRFGAPGDFAQAYVLAHEVGHHVQNVLGILPKVQQQRQQIGEAESNALSVRTELQADCFSGIWANHTKQKGILEEGDIEEALKAAAAVGDDTLQKAGQGYVVPDSFTHGTAEQRAQWFRRGYEQGTVGACDAFEGEI